MRIVLKGLHRVKRPLAGGGHSLHFYAWRGGPKITAKPDTPEFIAEFQRLTEGRNRELPDHHAGTFQSIITAYQHATEFTRLAPITRTGYVRSIRKIEAEFGSASIRIISDYRMRGAFLDWRDRNAKRGPRQADLDFAVLARIVSWALNRGMISDNRCLNPGRLSAGSRAAHVWTDAQIDALLAKAPTHVALPVQIARWTGQRQLDVLRLPWSAYDGQVIRLRQSKTGRHLTVPVTAELRAILDATPRRAVTICTTKRGTSWTTDGFKSSFATAKAEAKIEGLTFHDLRGTAVMELARAGCTVAEIASITGHALKDAETILEKHYFSRDRALGESAIAKLEKHKAGTRAVNSPCKRFTSARKTAAQAIDLIGGEGEI